MIQRFFAKVNYFIGKRKIVVENCFKKQKERCLKSFFIADNTDNAKIRKNPCHQHYPCPIIRNSYIQHS